MRKVLFFAICLLALASCKEEPKAPVVDIVDTSVADSLQRIIDQRDNDIAVGGGITGIDKDVVPVKNPGVDHRFSPDTKDIGFAGRYIFRGNREITLYIFLCEQGLAGSDVSDHRKGSHISPDNLKAVVTDLDRARFGGITPDIAVLLQRFQVRVDGRSGLEVHLFADLADRRRISLLKDLLLDILEDLHLLRTVSSSGHAGHPF